VTKQLTVTNFPSPSNAHDNFLLAFFYRKRQRKHKNFPLWEKKGKTEQKRVIIIITCYCFWWENNAGLISEFQDFLIHPLDEDLSINFFASHKIPLSLCIMNENSFLFISARRAEEKRRKKLFSISRGTKACKWETVAMENPPQKKD
jgi:hypothetical protein